MALQAVSPPAQRAVPRALLEEAETLSGGLLTLVEQFPDYEILTFLDRHGVEQHVSLRGLLETARAVQAFLDGRGLERGRVVLLALPTGPDLVAAYFGSIFAGGLPAIIPTPFHRFADPDVYRRHVGPIFELARAQFVCTSEDVARIYREAKYNLVGETAAFTPRDVPRFNSAPLPPPCSPTDIAMVQYTSGSTGSPKGVLLTHRAILNNMRSTRDGLRQTWRDVSVNWAPLYHDMGLIDTLLRPLFTGSPTVLIPTADFLRDPSLWLWAIHRYRATISWAPNFAYTLCAKRLGDEEVEGLDLSPWRVAINASEPVLADSIHAFATRFARFGFRADAMKAAWGVAEAVCIATASPVDEAPRIESIDRAALASDGIAVPSPRDGVNLVAIGRCLPGCQVQIRDGSGSVLPERRVGTIWLRTCSLFAGYQRNPALTADTFVDGWFNTGDRGYLAEGYLYFVAREKDLIVIGGEKYSPQDVEQAINSVPGVREGCAVAFGVVNQERGTEDVAAVVETRVTDQNVLTALRQRIQREVAGQTGLALRFVLLVPPSGIEKTTSGKLARSATHRRYVEQIALNIRGDAHGARPAGG